MCRNGGNGAVAGAAWGGIKGISLIPFYFQRKGTLVSEIAGNLFCLL